MSCSITTCWRLAARGGLCSTARRALASTPSLRRCARPRCATCGAIRRALSSTRQRCSPRRPVQPAIVTSPNNPTGDVAPLDFVAALCDACPGMVMVDEAYVEFADDLFGAAPRRRALSPSIPTW
ncbi:MAG: aminotransferase class I/II-fold pyridoxal phosphate-dependent enzyme [Collinsella sp.]